VIKDKKLFGKTIWQIYLFKLDLKGEFYIINVLENKLKKEYIKRNFK
jgi:hypothetical protein